LHSCRISVAPLNNNIVFRLVVFTIRPEFGPFHWRMVFNQSSPKSKAWLPPIFFCPKLLIQYIQSHSYTRRSFLHPQLETAPRLGNRGSLNVELSKAAPHKSSQNYSSLPKSFVLLRSFLSSTFGDWYPRKCWCNVNAVDSCSGDVLFESRSENPLSWFRNFVIFHFSCQTNFGIIPQKIYNWVLQNSIK
jgi:hypothetical protein